MNYKHKIIAIFAGFSIVIFSIGQGCGQVHSAKEQVSAQSLNETPPDQLKIIPNTKTVSMTYSRQILDSMVSCTGIKTPTDKIKKVFEERKGSLSEYGYALEVSSPMLMSATALAGEVCNRLIEMEQQASQSRIFTNIDFNKSPQNLTDDEIGDSVRRLARSCWLRNETPEELNVIISGVRDAMGSDGKTQDAMLMMCTGMLTSLSGLEI